jgi:hypothetical protein
MNDRQTELKEHSAHIFEMGCMEQRVYLKNDADAVIEAKDAEIAELKEAHKMEVDRLLMKIAGLEKIVETADKLLKPKGGFTIKDVEFCVIKLEGTKEADK